ncbi:MAG: hypothetical protein A2X86_06770 [Bdellovibrionales bacterium GWA2_49_15]|nr:MAG: hypothetical protein A2X86_06770 [Bdellovibrionales bacterium GWA2_49_15]
MADMMTNTLTFFVLLLSFAKTETSKQESALGSIRNAFGGLAYKMGETITLGKTADNDPAMLEAEDPARPFPIDFLSSEGLLDKHEMNRESTEILRNMRKDLATVGLAEQVDVYETSEGIKVQLKEGIVFKPGSVDIENIAIETFEKLVKLLGERDWVVFICGHAAPGERVRDGVGDATMLSAIRANVVTKSLIRRGVPATSITSTFYGDSRPISFASKSREENIRLSRRVEFILRKTDLYQEGRKVGGQK